MGILGQYLMHLLAPDILSEACGFSIPVLAVAFVLGLLLWLFGWRGHRFWIVLIATVGAGILGLYSGQASGMHPLVTGLLLAIAAGALALALVRVIGFVAGGLAAWLVVRALAPGWNEPLVCFFIGGLIGLLLFRLWMMALTSATGTLLMAYAGLCLAQSFGKLDVVALAERNAIALNWACGAMAFLGLIVQLLLDRLRSRRLRTAAASQHAPETYEARPWWTRGLQIYRRAG